MNHENRLEGATREQLAKVTDCRTALGQRFISARISKTNSFLYIIYMTKAGYYVNASYTQAGTWIKSLYYRDIHPGTGRLIDFMFKKP